MIRKLIRDYFPIILCVFLSCAQLKVFLSFINSLVIMALGLLISLIFYRDFYKQKFVLWMGMYAVVLVINNLFGDYYFKLITNIAEEICVLVFPAAFAYYIIKHKKYTVAKFLVYAFFILIIYSSITTLIVDSMSPDAVRTSVFLSNNEDAEALNFYYGLGMVTYRYCHALPILIPALIYAIIKCKRNIIFRAFSFFTLVALLLTVFLSNATTALLLAILALLTSLVVSEKSTQVTLLRLTVLMVVLIPFLISKDLLNNILESISSLFTDNTNSYVERLEEIKSMSATGKASGDLGGRVDKYRNSLYLLEGNILFGSDVQTGEHSAILDRLACLGLVGWIPYIIYIIKNTIKQVRMLPKKVYPYFIIGAATALIMLATKNMSNWDTWFMYFCLLPVILWFVSLEPNEVEILKLNTYEDITCYSYYFLGWQKRHTSRSERFV